MMPVREVHAIAAGIAGQRVRDWDQEGWRLKAACLGVDTSVFFPEDEDATVDDGRDIMTVMAVRQGASLAAAQTWAVRFGPPQAICAGCPVQEQCLLWAISTHQPYGIFGGLTTTDRTRVQRRMRYAIEHPVAYTGA